MWRWYENAYKVVTNHLLALFVNIALAHKRSVGSICIILTPRRVCCEGLSCCLAEPKSWRDLIKRNIKAIEVNQVQVSGVLHRQYFVRDRIVYKINSNQKSLSFNMF